MPGTAISCIEERSVLRSNLSSYCWNICDFGMQRYGNTDFFGILCLILTIILTMNYYEKVDIHFPFIPYSLLL